MSTITTAALTPGTELLYLELPHRVRSSEHLGNGRYLVTLACEHLPEGVVREEWQGNQVHRLASHTSRRARLVWHDKGEPDEYADVRCEHPDHGPIVLNSGHRYTAARDLVTGVSGLVHAQEFADEHNAQHHHAEEAGA